MNELTVSTVLHSPPAQVWAALRDIGSHVEWMADAESINFTSARREGVGTTFDCLTRVGPLRLVDRMEVTEWEDGRVMGIRHVGAVEGTGRFTLEPLYSGSHTRFTWSETLRFPWWLAGPLGGVLARPVLTRVWKANLRRLHRVVDAR